jgi:hypothetical protein
MTSAKPIPATDKRFIDALNKFLVPAIQKTPKPEGKNKPA